MLMGHGFDRANQANRKRERRAKPTETKVDVVVSEYEWVCPECNELNRECMCSAEYNCEVCGKRVETNPPEHNYN